jgi:hypothetical protein
MVGIRDLTKARNIYVFLAVYISTVVDMASCLICTAGYFPGRIRRQEREAKFQNSAAKLPVHTT